ncbi:MAG TPA: phytanoyl-CoA dioxygenase family protein [Thermoanaerobaculia bacterium]|jgi:hypothetical protein
MKVLTREQAESYRRDGVLFPLPVLSPAEVARYRACVEELEARLGGNPKPSDMTQPQLHFRWAYELATHPAVLDAIEDVLGPDILVHSASIFSKPANSQAYVSWHQDGAYWGLSEPGLTSAWIALSDSTVENGCLRVIPGSHTRRILPFAESARSPDNLLASGMEIAVEVDERQARDVVLRAGEMSLHHVDIVHGSNANRSATRRVGFAVRYLPPRVSQALEHHEVLLARGRDDHCHYRLLGEPPAPGLEEGLTALAEFSQRWRQIRLGR